MRLTTDYFTYFKKHRLFCCSINTISDRVNDCIILSKDIIITNPKSGGTKMFKYSHQDKKKWIFCSGDITLYVYKGDKHKGIPSPGIVTLDEQSNKIQKMVKKSGFPELIQSFTI